MLVPAWIRPQVLDPSPRPPPRPTQVEDSLGELLVWLPPWLYDPYTPSIGPPFSASVGA